MPQASYSISELASDFDVSTRTIRFYEEKGLLDPERKGQTRKLIDKIRERQRLLKEQLRDIKAMLGELDEAEARCAQALAEMKGE